MARYRPLVAAIAFSILDGLSSKCHRGRYFADHQGKRGLRNIPLLVRASYVSQLISPRPTTVVLSVLRLSQDKDRRSEWGNTAPGRIEEAIKRCVRNPSGKPEECPSHSSRTNNPARRRSRPGIGRSGGLEEFRTEKRMGRDR